jgi:TRAP-type uncharacterized transport system substrate-binding protein
VRVLRAAIASCVLLAFAPAAETRAEEIVVSSGKPGGYYASVAGRMRYVLGSELDQLIDLRSSEGSLENLGRLDDDSSPVNIALTQADALAHYLRSHPAFEKKYVVLVDLGRECAFLVAPRKDGITKASDLHVARGQSVAVGDTLSGAAVTYEHLSHLDTRFRNTPAKNISIIEAMLDLKTSPRRLNVAAAMVVQRPLVISAPVEIAMDNRDLYRFVPIREEDVQGDPAAKSKYAFETIDLGFGRDYKVSLETICTQGLILGAKGKFSKPMLAKIAQLILDSRRYIMPGRN